MTLLAIGLGLLGVIFLGLAIMEARDESRLKDEQDKEADELEDWK